MADEEEIKDDSIRGELEKAFEEVVEKPAEPEIKPAADKPDAEPKPPVEAKEGRDKNGKFAKKEEKIEPVEKTSKAPNSWTSTEKAEWDKLTPAAKAAVERREAEVERGFTKHDEERNLGKAMREVVSPYMPIITAEGGNPVSAVKELLNTAYILRTAPVAQKTALFHQLAKQYGVDLSQNNTQAAQPDQVLAQTQQQLAELRQQIAQQPQVFRQQQETMVLQSTIDAFAADPKNVHFDTLKPVMASLLQSGQAKDLQDAYDKASWANPDIRTSILEEQRASENAKLISQKTVKTNQAKKASASLTGSPGVTPVANGASTASIRDALSDAWDAHAS